MGRKRILILVLLVIFSSLIIPKNINAWDSCGSCSGGTYYCWTCCTDVGPGGSGGTVCGCPSYACTNPSLCSCTCSPFSCCDYSPACTSNGNSCGNCGTYTGCSTACNGGCTGCTCSGDATAIGGACSDGDDCCSGVCIAGYCRTSCTGYDDSSCSEDSNAYNGANGGVCISGVCDVNEVCDDTVNYQTDCSVCSVLDECDNNVGPGYTADGICISDNSCDNSGEVCYDGSDYQNDCSVCGAIDVNPCDTDITDLSYDVSGICVSDGSCDTSAVALDSGTYYGVCTTHGGKICDGSVIDGSFSQEGICVDETDANGCLKTGFVYYNGSNYNRNTYVILSDYSNSSTNFDGMSCDFTFTNGDYSAEGMVNSSSECQLVGTLMILDDEDDFFKGTCDSSPDSCGLITSNLDSPWSKQGVCCNNVCVGESESDCCDKSDCSDGQLCVNYGCEDSSNITINNLGITGIEQSNQEYTSSRNVLLNLFFSVNAIKCRYINHDDSTTLPNNDSIDWSIWQSCVSNMVWELSETSGPKTVYYQVNYTTYLSTSNDSINYNFSGYGLDTTNPSNMSIYHNNYTNDFENITISWTDAIDPESSIFEIPLIYNISLFNESGILIANASTTSLKKDFTIPEELWQSHGTYYYAVVKVINSAGLTNSSRSTNLYIDTEPPIFNFVDGQVYNISSKSYMDVLDEDSWFYANTATINWDAIDSDSGIYGFSFYLNKGSSKEPDHIVDGTTGLFYDMLSKIYSGLSSGKHYFTIKARDIAGNWGTKYSINFSIDNTPPTAPRILTKTKNGKDYTFTWSASSDPESDITNYMLILNASGIRVNTTINDTDSRSFTFDNLEIDGEYNITAGALNGAGIWSWDDIGRLTIDNTAPVITSYPSVRVSTNYPIIRLWTNEQAVCRLDSLQFTYTNTTYHEIKTIYYDDGVHSFTVYCKDTSGNEVSDSFDITVDSNATVELINIDDPVSAYENTIKTITVDFSNTTLIAGIVKNRVELYLDNTEKDFSLFDFGDGSYNISFFVPENKNYTLRLNVDGVDENITLESKSLGLSSVYENPEIITSEKKSHLSYYYNETNMGLATDDDININEYTNKLNISYISIENNLFIFNTKNALKASDRNKRLDQEKFIYLVNPSFGYPITEEYYLNYILDYEDYELENKLNSKISQGKHDIKINRALEEGIKIVFENEE